MTEVEFLRSKVRLAMTICLPPPLFLLFLTFGSCAAQKNSGRPYYHEDLYYLRPKFSEPVDTVPQVNYRKKKTVIPLQNINYKVDDVLDSINRFNTTRKFIDGFTIQIYSGQNKEEAMNIKKKMMTEPSLTAEMEYNQPKFRVRVGRYYSRMEAQKDLVRLKKHFSNAILVPEKILVR